MKLLTEEAAKELNKELQSKIHTSRYNDAYEMVDALLRDLEAKDKKVLIEPWKPLINNANRHLDDLSKAYGARLKELEDKVETLEKKLVAKNK